MIPFDPTGELPAGRTVLEASAGTGKTWTIAALVTRYVAEEGVPIDQMLVVTFTRAATFELRERCRARLVQAARHLRDPQPTDDVVLTHLADCDATTRELRFRQVDDALRGFDRATITTLHGLAHRFLQEMGLLARTTPPREVVGDQDDILDDVINDTYVAMFAAGSEFLDSKTAHEIAKTVAGVPDADIVPAVGETDGEADLRSRFAYEVRQRMADRIRTERVTSFDGLLLAARDALRHTESGQLAAARLRRRYRVALIDEFQDTDGIQWQTVDAVFADPTATMVLIGDPKQSIYAFRGADIGAYLEAADGAPSRFTLQTNWRSDGPLLQALDVVFGDVTFGDHRISYLPVLPAPRHNDARIRHIDAPLLVRYVGRDAPVKTNQDTTLSVPAARSFIAADTASYIVDLLTRPAEIHDDGTSRPVRPGDIAVLCRTNYEVDSVRQALAERRVPAVVARTGNVLESQAVDDWLCLLEALESPASSQKVRAVSLTCFIGWSAQRLAAATDTDLLPLHDRIAGWATTLRDQGVAALWKTIEAEENVTTRVLAAPGGERLITDLGHVTEMIHAAHRSGAFSLHEWLLSANLHAKQRQDEDEDRSRRLETDADAVQVLTAHASKGLEFPIVLCPFFWSTARGSGDVLVFHPEGSDRRLAAVAGKSWDGHADAKALVDQHSDGEDMRLLYVALTRARHHVAVWWAPTSYSKTAPLSRFLFGRTPDGIGDDVKMDTDERLLGHLDTRLKVAGATIVRQQVTDAPSLASYQPPAPETPTIEVARFDRPIDRAWIRTSFSGLTRDAPHVRLAEAEAVVKMDEPVDEEPVEDEAVTVDALPMADLPGGMAFGNLVHSVFEEVDLAAADRAERIRALCDHHVLASGSTADPEVLTAALLAVAETPLFGAVDSPRLIDIPRTDQRAEMEFELPISPDGPVVTVARIADLIEDHLDASHPFRPYAERVRSLSRHAFHGYMTGAIDGVIRFGDQYWVMDYKTNRLGDYSRPLTSSDYHPTELDRAMTEGDYVLQSLLYQVALHRYLSVRLGDYRPSEHLGGSLYLFVRGMSGPDTPVADGQRNGVHRWDAPHELIAAVSELFAQGAV